MGKFIMGFKRINKNSKELDDFKNEPIINLSNSNNKANKENTTSFPWQEWNKKSVRPKKQFILKINQYYHTALTYFAKPEEGLSMQKIINEILIPVLDKKIEKEESKK